LIEILVADQKVKININPRNITRLKKLGYECNKYEEIEINAEHLSNGSNVEVRVVCDYCKRKEFTRLYSSHFSSSQKDYLGDCCDTCSHLRRSKITINANKLDYSFVKQEFEKRNYILLTNDFEGQAVTSVKLEYLCNKHLYLGSLFISWNHFHTKKQGCKHCAIVTRPSWEGENNPSWKGGISDKNNRERHSNKYKRWVKEVYIRDKYTCQCCSRVGGELRAHHIDSFSKYKSKRYEISNGMTLCRSCHDVDVPNSFQNKYGTVNQTSEELFEFIRTFKSL
jgi:hypothetical protein